MANTSAIAPKYHNEILNLVSEGIPVVKITSMLNEKYQTNFNYDAVNRVVVKLRKEYQEIAKAKLVQGVEATATADLHILDTVITTLFEQYQSLIEENNIDQALKVSSELNKWNARRIELSGINKSDVPISNDDAKEEILEQLCKLAQN